MQGFSEHGPQPVLSPSPKAHGRARSLNGCEHPESSHLPSPFPEAACPSLLSSQRMPPGEVEEDAGPGRGSRPFP